MSEPSTVDKLAASLPFKVSTTTVVGVVLVLGLAKLGTRPALSHLDVTILSGSTQGNYHSIVSHLGTIANKHGGKVSNQPSEGSLDNVQKLIKAQQSCSEHFALVQAGLPWPEGTKLDLVGKLGKAESVFILGKNADKIDGLKGLEGKTIGVGPDTSGTAQIARDLLALPELMALGAKPVTGSTVEQISKASRGELDLVMLVIDEDAPLIVDAIRNQGLEILNTPNIDAIARRFNHLRAGRIGAGQFDAVKMYPAADRKVLRVNTLIVGNGCARRSQTLGLLTTLNELDPEFLAHNRETGNRSGLPMNAAAKSYFDHQGLEPADEYLPWLVDIMPASFWVNVFLAISLLFNFMSLGNRFRLWRIDAARLQIEADVAKLLGPSLSTEDIERLEPTDVQCTQELVDKLNIIVNRLLALESKSREQSLSMLSPMGQEMTFRYQEKLCLDLVAAIRTFCGKILDRLNPIKSE